jgi:hypothetical protein
MDSTLRDSDGSLSHYLLNVFSLQLGTCSNLFYVALLSTLVCLRCSFSFFPLDFFYLIRILPYASNLMPRRRNVKAFLDRARENGADVNRQGINGEKVNSNIGDQTKKDYEGAQNMWRESVFLLLLCISLSVLTQDSIGYRFCAEKGKSPVASAYDLESLKDFVQHLAYGIEGRYDNKIAGQGSVKVLWKRFMAGFKRAHDAIPKHTTNSVTNVRHHYMPLYCTPTVPFFFLSPSYWPLLSLSPVSIVFVATGLITLDV